MKNRKATYALGFAVLVVWGLILYRVFHNDDEGEGRGFSAVPTAAPKEVLNDYSTMPDTALLRLNYRDPFGSGSMPPDTSHPLANNLTIFHPISALPSKPFQTDWGFIRYSGFVRNPKNKCLIAMVNIRGKDMMMSEGETVEEVRLVKNLQDSVRVWYKGQSKIIKINSTTISKGL